MLIYLITLASERQNDLACNLFEIMTHLSIRSSPFP